MKFFLLIIIFLNQTAFAKDFAPAKNSATVDSLSGIDEACKNFVITPECPINRCYPDYYQALATYATGLDSCKAAIELINNCGHANTGTLSAISATTRVCDLDKSISKKIKNKVLQSEKSCLKENKDEGGTLGSYIRASCKLNAYLNLIK